MLVVAVAAAMVAATPAGAVSDAAPGPSAGSVVDPAARPLFRLSDPRVDEASGLAVGTRSPDVLYVHNDSGDRPRFFALDAATGRVLAECDVPGADNVDWEDIATGLDSRGVPSVWLADIGDNDASRRDVVVYRVDEPDLAGAGATVRTAAPDVWRLRYPDGPRNAEAVFVDPVSHRIYLATKSLLGSTEVFLAPPLPTGAQVATLARIGSVRLSFTGTSGGPNVIGQLTVTGASMAPVAAGGSAGAEASVLALRTYTDAYLWRVHGSDVAAALRAKPVRVALPPQPLGEGVAVRGQELLADSEGVGSVVYSVPIPSTLLTAAAQPAASAARARPADPTAASQRQVSGRTSAWPVVAAAGCAIIAAGVVAAARRWRMRRSR